MYRSPVPLPGTKKPSTFTWGGTLSRSRLRSVLIWCESAFRSFYGMRVDIEIEAVSLLILSFVLNVYFKILIAANIFHSCMCMSMYVCVT